MTNITELRKKFEEKFPLLPNVVTGEMEFFPTPSADEVFTFLLSEIEAAERKGFKSGYIEGLHYAGDNICQEDLDKITDSFLKNPEQ